MKLYIPDYYDAFSCVASACPDSCCKEWEVDVDEASAAYYRTLDGALGDRLRQVLRDTPDGTMMTIENGRCPMWLDNGLCRIQSELGHDALCTICRQYPRLVHDFGDFQEYGLELSCPEAARLILESEKCVFSCKTSSENALANYDAALMQILRHSRQKALDILDDPSYCVCQALTLVLLYAHCVQQQLDGGEEVIFDPEKALETAKAIRAQGSLSAIYDFFLDLEILTQRWENKLKTASGVCRFSQVHRALARYFVLRYWLQACFDFDLVSRAKLAVTACLLNASLDGDPIENAQLFSKEIENDPDNLDAVLDAAYTSPAFTDAALLHLLSN